VGKKVGGTESQKVVIFDRHCAFPTGIITNAQNFNFATKFLQNGFFRTKMDEYV